MEAPHERKVRMVYDALRAKNWKGAIKMADTALQKFKTSLVLKSLKAFSLEKLGRQPQAFELCEEIRSTGTADEQVLHTLGMIYRSMDRLDCLTEAYTTAVAKNSGDIDLMLGLFACYVRECAFAKQQQLATKMYRRTSQSDRYLWWVVISIVLQVWKRPSTDSKPPPLGVANTLKLAQSMIQKHLQTAKKLSSLEGLFMYIDILFQQGHAKQVSELLITDFSTICKQPLQLPLLKAQCYLHLNDFEQASNLLKDILIKEPDHWVAICVLLDLYLPLESDSRSKHPTWCQLCLESCQLVLNLKETEAEESEKEESKPELAQQAFEFIQTTLSKKIDDQTSPNPSLNRCLVLTEVEYTYRKMKCGLCEEYEFVECIQQSLEKIGHFKSIGSDLEFYVQQLRNPSKLFEVPGTKLKFSESEEISEDSKSCFVNTIQILSTLEVEYPQEKIQDFIRMGLKFPEIDGSIISALNFLLTKKSVQSTLLELGTPVWQAYILASLASLASPASPQLLLIQSTLAFLLGAPKGALEIYEKLEIKHTQLDSIASHLWYPFMKSYQCKEAIRQFQQQALSLFTTQKLDVEEMTFEAYQQGTYTKILEFVSFKERLEMSHTFHLTISDQSFSNILASFNKNHIVLKEEIMAACEELSLEKISGDYFERLMFNENVQIRPSWLPLTFGDYRFASVEWWQDSFHPQNQTNNDHINQWKKSRISFLKRQWCTPHLLKRLFLMEESSDSEPPPALVVVLQEMGTSADSALEFFRKKLDSEKAAEEHYQNLLDLYVCFQTSILSLSRFSPVVFTQSLETEEHQSWINLVCKFCMELTTASFQSLEYDLSVWVKSSGVILGALLHEEIPLLLTTLPIWKTACVQNNLKEDTWKLIKSLKEGLQSSLEKMVHYLSLVETMDVERVTQNMTLLLGLKKEKEGEVSFESEIQDKDIKELSLYMENLNLEDYEWTSQWWLSSFNLGEEMMKIKDLLEGIFEENKQWGQHLLTLAKEHLSVLASIETV